MKKLVFFVAALFTTYFAQAQEGIKLGLKAGGNFSNLTGKDADDDSEYVFGFHGGAFLDYGISDMVSIRPELLYTLKGAKGEIKEDDMDYTEKLRMHYLELPLLVRINTGSPGLFFEAGPTFSYLLTAKATAEGEIDGEEIDESETVTETFKKLDIGYAAGLGYQLGSGLGLGLRYVGGLSKIIDADDEDDSPKINNSVFQLSLSYTLGAR
ncbi:porin family protein [Rufibacter latericius]|uniref:PorT family protein n=1 Tax=Rufibacter latericius TaxID=2487040 RepID=A0A3M9ME25_9BACT|nr:porin family protein [Rufibacter latericius]RNI23387.1 PorT family protein [Rufibacter latericius]